MSFLSYLINGVSLGSIYAIIALGYTMVYGIAKMLNFAHGDVIMIGAFVMLSALNTMSLPLIPAVLVAVVACTVLGVVIERVAYRPLRNAASPLAVLITAIGVSYLLQNVALLIFGANTVSFPNKITLPALSLAGGSLVISSVTIVTIVACVVIMIALLLFINRTKAGQAMLAVSEDKGAAQLMGINVDGTIALTFAIGSALAAIAGFLLFTAYPSLDPYKGAMPGIKAFVAAVFDIFGCEEVGGGYSHRTELVQGHDGEPELVVALEHQHHAVVAAYAETLEKRCSEVGEAFELAEGEASHISGLVGPEQGLARGFLLSPSVDHIISEIEVVGYFHLEIAHHIVVIAELCLPEKSFNHIENLC